MKRENGLENILFYGRHIITVPSGNEDNSAFAGTALKNLSDYGFVLDEAGVNALSTASKEDIERWYYDTAEKLNQITGGSHTYRPFYPNFPEEVMQASELQLFIEQIAHYWVGYMPEGENVKENVKSLEEHPLKVLVTMDENDKEGISKTAAEIFKNILKSKQTVSEADMKNIINPYVENVKNWTVDAKTVENRLLLSYLYATALLQHKNIESLPNLVTNDYLRIARVINYMSANEQTSLTDLSVVGNQPLRTLPRSVRRFMAEGLESQRNLEEDISRDKNTWKVAFRLIHIGEYKECKKVNDVAYKLRNNQRLETFYSKIERAFADKDYKSLLRLYSQRPGEMIKNMNRLIMLDIKKENRQEYANMLINRSKEVFKKVRPEDLVNFMEYIKSRTREDRLSIHNVKGVLMQSDNKYEVIPEKAAEIFINMAKSAIAEQVLKGKELGAIYMDPGMEKMVLPKDIKDSSESMNRYTKGSRLPLEKNEDGTSKNIRAFIWWTNTKKEQIDIDLSANFYSKDDNALKYEGSVSYHRGYCLYGCVHSGDITDGGAYGGKGVCEYIDINFDELRGCGIDYVQFFVNSYRGQSFSEIPCEMGWMEREEMDKSKQFDIKAVKQHSSLSGDIKGITSFILDVNKGEIVWIDSPDFHVKACSNSLSVVKSIDCIMERYCKSDRMTMGEMVNLAVESNCGHFVDSPEKADTLFMVSAYQEKTENQRVITSKDQDIWLGEFMSPQVDNGNEPECKESEKELSVIDIINGMESVNAGTVQNETANSYMDATEEASNMSIDEEDFEI